LIPGAIGSRREGEEGDRPQAPGAHQSISVRFRSKFYEIRGQRYKRYKKIQKIQKDTKRYKKIQKQQKQQKDENVP
jgi:hypothetical protein